MASNWRLAPLTPPNLALCTYAEKLTYTPAQISDDDITALRQHGFTDRAIHDATQVISYFNYINRIADGLAVDLEDFVHAWESGVPS